MKRAKRILLIASVLLVATSSADAGLFGSRNKAAETKPAEAVTAPTIALSAVETEGSRVLLRTSGAPAYTSYSPAPGVFVVDLTGTTRDAGVAVPQTLPPAVKSSVAEQVTEMGSTLTRVTFRLADSLIPEVAAIEKAVVITIPATAIPIETAHATEEVLPAVTPAAPEPTPAQTATTEAAYAPSVEVIPEPVVEHVAEPIVETLQETPATVEAPATVMNDAALPRARSVKRIDAKTNGGNVEVRIAGDGKLTYKAFRLEAPSRLVIDLEGVKNNVAKNSIDVADDVVKRVRVAQFQPTVARVVVDLSQKSEYDIAAVGDELRIAFGASAVASKAPAAPQPRESKPAPVQISEAKPPAQKPMVMTAPADIPSQVPTVAENAQKWDMPKPARREPASKGARSVISAPAPDQAPTPTRPATTQEDVFSDAQQQTQPVATMPAGQSLTGGSGTRTLSADQRVFNGDPVSMNLKDADLKDVLRTFSDLTGLNMAIDPGVTGSVTVDFTDVPWDQALDLILRQNGLTFTLEGNVMRIGTVERIAAETSAKRRLAEEERLNVQLTTLGVQLSYARASEVASLLKDIASPRARILIDTRTNQLIISEIPEFLRTMQNLIATVDIPTRQVMIEARIVETQRQFQQQWGVTWGFGGDLDPALGTGTGLVFPNRIGFTGGPFEFGLGRPLIDLHLFDILGTFNLDLALLAAESEGYIKVISAPRVTTQDNTAADIQSGFQIPYQTRINFTTTIQYLDATLRLSVTPQITQAGTIIMDIALQKNEPAEGLVIIGSAGTPLTTRQAHTRLMVRDGGTAVIAGIFTTRDNNAQSRVPFVHNIPVIGALFRSHAISTQHDELLIFITPRIVRG
ncbi:MAG TPA: type IV pilus secretin PilQ [Thermoanaerobaculia bacterium]|nr:type IV pilus secretin PilQ [Thermoanaerobaculia bacterium]